MGFIAKLFGGSDIVGAIERVALEAIDTPAENAEANSLWIKTLDPNGIMRRNLSSFACKAYGWYLAVSLLLVLAHAFGLTNTEQSQQAIEAIKELFLPITGAWAGIVSASFGVNAANTIKSK